MKTLTQRLIKRYSLRVQKYGKQAEKTLKMKALVQKAQKNFNPSKEFNKSSVDIPVFCKYSYLPLLT